MEGTRKNHKKSVLMFVPFVADQVYEFYKRCDCTSNWTFYGFLAGAHMTSHHEWFLFTRTSNLYLGGYVPSGLFLPREDYMEPLPRGYPPLHVQAGSGEGAPGGSGGLGAGPHEGELRSSG